MSSGSISNEDHLNYLVQSTKSSKLSANDTFSISGSIISTIDIKSGSNISLDNLQDVGLNEGISGNANGNETNGSIFESQRIDNSGNSLSFNQSIQQFPSPTVSNQTDNLSNNLVSMLSGIIIQSIEKGNPTINRVNISDPFQMKKENVSIILSGNWKMAVSDANVTVFELRFIMITSNGIGFHWHSLNNFKTNYKAYFGEDDNIYLKGTMDFFTDNRSVLKDLKTIIIINNFETIQILILDDRIAAHLYGNPIFGTIDMIEIPN